eukprot:3617226-Amphidinium_carterae.1
MRSGKPNTVGNVPSVAGLFRNCPAAIAWCVAQTRMVVIISLAVGTTSHGVKRQHTRLQLA